MEQPPRTGPLEGLKIVEFAGIGPAPMCAMLLADLGATVIRIDRVEKSELGVDRATHLHLLNRSRETIKLDLKSVEGGALAHRLIDTADALIEGFRPGVMERLGFGPEQCLARNRRLVYGRMTGWGQNGPLAQAAGHDINYIAVTGVLDAIGAADGPPTVPLNLIGDFGGGALYLAMGLLAGLIEARRSGEGQVVDAAIVDGTASLTTILYGLSVAGAHGRERGTNLLDGGAYFYGVYTCADGRYLAVGPVERRFHDILLRRLGIDPEDFPSQNQRARWPEARAQLALIFASAPRPHWEELFADTDACVSPVLSFDEAIDHPQLGARQTIITLDGVAQPAPAPRFSRTPSARPYPPGEADARAALRAWLPPAELEAAVSAIESVT